MARIKTLIIGNDLEIAERKHSCKGNSKHQINKGQQRLKIKNKYGKYDRYCLDCATKIINRDLDRLTVLSERVKNLLNS